MRFQIFEFFLKTIYVFSNSSDKQNKNMKFDENWVKEWINFDIGRKDLLEQIERIGIERNRNKNIPQSKYFDNFIVGEIIDHYNVVRNKDTFKIFKVNIGEKTLKIVCDSPNCQLNMKVAVFRYSYEEEHGKKDRSNKFSEGYLCRYDQLFFLKNNKNIIEIPKHLEVGSNIGKYLAQYSHRVFNTDSISNRKDFSCILGICRDISAINNKKINLKRKTIEKNVHLNHKGRANFYIKDPEYCPIVFSKIIKGVHVYSKTPDWMKERLSWNDFSTVDTINNIVNYVTLEMGQHVSVYDCRSIKGNIEIRKSKGNENIIFQKKKLNLIQDTLVISDENSTMSIAGMIKNEKFEINQNTSEILLICAFFNNQSIHKDIEHYFSEFCLHRSHNKDPDAIFNTLERASELITKFCGGIQGDVTEIVFKKYLPKLKEIVLDVKKIHRMIGCVLSIDKISQILVNLGFHVFSNIGLNKIKIKIPFWRRDIFSDEDIIDEIIRIYGYDNLPKRINNIPNIQENHMDSLHFLKKLLVYRGYHEIITYSFIDEKIQNLLFPRQNYIKLPDPMSSHMSVMRTSLIPGMLSTIQYNQRRQNNKIKIFESGHVFFTKKEMDNKAKMDQRLMLSAAITSHQNDRSWLQNSRETDFFDIKGDLEIILRSIIIKNYDVVFKKSISSTFDKEQFAKIYLCGEFLGHIGMLHREIERRLEINNRVFIFEILINKLLNNKNLSLSEKYEEISKFPINHRDISMIFREEIPAHEILIECQKVSLSLQNGIVVFSHIFDMYRGDPIKSGYKSISIGFTIQSSKKTMQEHEISRIVDLFVERINTKFSSNLRKK
ncbi:hypothetical protein AOQ87_02205 [Candidatus Riesia pediculischaeffi]|uniref:Phenylalanine--tRNA ligase beta subunit n=2 Tax=Candidatus Riesia pediculischaeffi TaxID=428411 RepID=A0A1V0HKT6_9ENTR|nr:hypothetical protein AOQ87_02205 [Candidatus Riesia pediculischaeffi]